jgi:predicted lactoylglutathione lyase
MSICFRKGIFVMLLTSNNYRNVIFTTHITTDNFDMSIMSYSKSLLPTARFAQV